MLPTIGLLQQGELSELAVLWRRSRKSAQPWLEQRMGYTLAEDHAQLRDVLARECDVWVARHESRALGFLALAFPTPREGWVEQLYVDPPAQRRGVGSALIGYARSRSPSGLSLFTHRHNLGARAFYERSGFRAVAFATSPPPESEPDVRYRWAP